MPASLKKNPFFRSFAQIALWCYCIYSLLLFWNISGNQLLLWQPMSLPIVSSWFLCFWDTAVSCSCRQNCWRGSFSPADHGKIWLLFCGTAARKFRKGLIRNAFVITVSLTAPDWQLRKDLSACAQRSIWLVLITVWGITSPFSSSYLGI